MTQIFSLRGNSAMVAGILGPVFSDALAAAVAHSPQLP